MVPSPCTGICTMRGDTCAGCHRTLDEIAAWGSMDDEQKMEVLERLLLTCEFSTRPGQPVLQSN